MRPYALVALLGAFLLFLVQPMIARAILPWFGGAAGVWTTCLVFFQALLLAGYAYAHLGRRLGRRRRASVHVGLLVLSLAALPVLPSAAWRPAGDEAPVLHILIILTVSVGAPYALLAATAPLLQDWSAARAANDVRYRLYAWSNTGSLLALIGYPLVVEPLATLEQQAWAWSGAYVLFAAASAWLALRSRRDEAAEAAAAGATTDDASAAAAAPPTRADRARWLVLPACGCGLLVAITHQLTLDVAVVPLLFIAPLALYLVSYIVAFAGAYRPLPWRLAHLAGAAAMVFLVDLGAAAPLSWQVVAALVTLAAGCMVCHGELARLAPPPRHATAFYLSLAAGGAAGGVVVAVLAPLVLTELWELPLFVLAPLVLAPRVLRRRRALEAALTAVAVVALALLFVRALGQHDGVVVASSRGFYGTLRVVDLPGGAVRALEHGRIEHGVQLRDPARRHVATTYYSKDSGVELAIRHHPRRAAGLPLRIGVIGLGVGTVATWARAGDHVRFFELDPAVERMARRHFSFLADSAGTVDVVVGDGRLSLERELRDPAAPRYDVLIVDAFLGDAIPVHLLTRECAASYGRALAADGVLALHISNRHLDLAPVVLGVAAHLRRRAVRVHRHAGGGAQANIWMLITDSPAYHRLRSRPHVTVDHPRQRAVRWTDHHSSLLPLIRWL